MIKMDKDIFSLKNKIVLITGASGLLGFKHAEAVALFGGVPILLDLDKNLLLEQVKVLNKEYETGALSYVLDITNEMEIKKNCKDILKRFGKIDALVNNAANNPKFDVENDKEYSRLENFPIKNWDADISVGLTGAFLCTKYYGNAISNNKEGGVILNISSDLGIIAPDQRLYQKAGLPKNKQPVKPVSYSVVKTGLIGLTRYTSTYWPNSVRCNALCPGGVDNALPSDFMDKVIQRIPMGRMANPDEYQGSLVYLLSEASKYMNGAVICLDGGRSVW